MSHVPNFWDPNESSSDDEYNTPSSPSSVALETPQLLSVPRASRSHHAQRQSVSAIRLPVQMSDDEEEEQEGEQEQPTLEEEEGQEEQQEREEYKQLPDAAAENSELQEDDDKDDDVRETEGEVAQPAPAAAATEPRSSTREMLFKLSDKRVGRTAEEQKEQQAAEQPATAFSSAVGDSSPVQSALSTPPPIPARRSSQPLPALSLPPSRFTSTMPMPSFPPPPSASPLSSSPPSTTPPDTGRPSSSPSLAAQSLLSASSVPPRPSSASASAASSSPARSFSSHLRHCFEPVSRQAATGSYTTKRAASLLKRLALLEEQHAVAITKAVQLEAAKMGRLGSDGMEAGGAGWTLLCDVLNTAQQSRNTAAHSVMTEVVVPLLEYYGDAEDRRRELVAEERKATLDMGRQAEEVQRGLSATVKLLQTARQQMQHDMDSGSMTKTLTKHFRQSVKQTTAQAVKSARLYSDSIAAANARQQRYQQAELPLVFNGLEQLERGRLELLKQKLLRFTDLQAAALQQQLTQLQQTRQQLAAQLSPSASISAYIDATVTAHPAPASPAPITYALGVSVRDMEEGRLDAPAGPTAAAAEGAVFGQPLHVLMEREEERRRQEVEAGGSDAAEEEEGVGVVPRVLSACVHRLSEADGYATEGIFRISIPKQELESLRAAVDRDEYEPLQQHSNPHAAAALLKDFLRSLPQPIIADSLYAHCVAVGMERAADGLTCDEETCLRAVAAVGEEERRVLSLLSAVCDRVDAQSEVTRMSCDTLAIVFAPCLLRNRSADAARLLEYTKYETKFVAALMKGMVRQRRRRRKQQQQAAAAAEPHSSNSSSAVVLLDI